MKKISKQGYTLLEIVIVIAVIAILAAVLIPTFASIIGSSQDRVDKTNADTIYKQYVLGTSKENIKNLLDYNYNIIRNYKVDNSKLGREIELDGLAQGIGRAKNRLLVV